MSQSPLDMAREKAKEMREAGMQIVRLDPIQKARANPKSKALAIKAMCWECVGAGADPNPRGMIKECQVPRCPLYTVRPWQDKTDDEEADAPHE